MTIFKSAIIEMKQRSDFLRTEIDLWREEAENNIDDFGVHRSQLRTLEAMMDVLLERQTTLLQSLTPELPQLQFAMGYSRLIAEIVGSQELWSVFRHIFGQLHDPHLGDLLDAANRIASDCYLNWLNQAKITGLITEDRFREPPLVYLEPDFSAATANRGTTVGALGFSVNRHRELRLPVPVVIMPSDQISILRLLCVLHHEVGHNVDQDLGLRDELKEHLNGKVADERLEVWQFWTTEILADALAVISGGAGFVHSLSSFLFLMAPKSVTLNTADVHPDHYIRLFLLAEMLEKTGVTGLSEVATEIRDLGTTLKQPNGAQEYITEVPAVAELLITQPLEALDNRSLLDMSPNLAQETGQVKKLASFLRSGSGFLEPAEPLPPRLVPVGAEMALAELDDPDESAVAEINERAYAYLDGLKRPEFLAGADRSQFLRQLSEEIDFMEAA